MFNQEEPWVISPDKQTTIAMITPPKKRHRCHHCRYSTNRRNNLQRHIQAMHSQTAIPLRCCGTDFQNKAALRQHTRACHRDGYTCQECGRVFCRKALLRRHHSVHSGVREHVCDMCDYATSHKSNLERHKKVHDRDSSETDHRENNLLIEAKTNRETTFAIPKSDNDSSLTQHVSDNRMQVVRPIPRLPEGFSQRTKPVIPFSNFSDKYFGLKSNPWHYPSILVPPPIRPSQQSLVAMFDPVHESRRPHCAGNIATSWYDCPLCAFSLDACRIHRTPYFVPNFLRQRRTLPFPVGRHFRTETPPMVLGAEGKDITTIANARLPLKKRDIIC
ncbi:histone-lysine N-methyltransferase PRDM16-like [Lineus longissimus]|uniref:histone-lysine N-methyltransferase PRDM16-like n=1 Tax=Lineus longissimus TaxID=88925 RepID=UPI00315D8555